MKKHDKNSSFAASAEVVSVVNKLRFLNSVGCTMNANNRASVLMATSLPSCFASAGWMVFPLFERADNPGRGPQEG